MAKVPKYRDRTQLFMCTGENFNRYVAIGDVGEIKPLTEWLKYFYKETDEEISRRFNSTWSNKKIVEYLYSFLGKKLEPV